MYDTKINRKSESILPLYLNINLQIELLCNENLLFFCLFGNLGNENHSALMRCCLQYSHMKSDALTWTLSDRTTPNCGISTAMSNRFITFGGMPSFSWPNTNTIRFGSTVCCNG